MEPFATMKTTILAALGSLLLGTLHANPAIHATVAQTFGEAQASNIILVLAAPNPIEPVQWTVYARDPFRVGEQVRSIVTFENGAWKAEAAGAGNLLQKIPPQRIDFTRVKLTSVQAREILNRGALAAQVPIAKVRYQLASNPAGAPEWGLQVLDASNVEVGFTILSAETGAIVSQDWTPAGVPPKPDSELTDAERAAREVKHTARKAWDWTENAGRETGRFFKELFRKDD